jgi:pyruvate/2-oxoglutarate dehydrogenase complex dihydrolipoamide acyltransferase (E2) component
MNETPAGLLLFGVIFLLLLFIGIFAAIIVYVGKIQDKKEPSSRTAPAPPQEVVPKPPQEEPEPEVEQPARPGEVMRVIRDRETGRVLVEVDGQRYAHLREIRDAGVGRRVLWAIADLVRFTGGMATNPQAVQHAREAEAGAVPEPTFESPTARLAPPPGPPASSRSASPGASSPRLSDLTSLGTTEPSAPQQSYSLIDYFRRGFQAPQPTEAVPGPSNFIEEIDEILQRMVRELPRAPSQPVRVASGEDGMLQIIVGIQTYHSADEVPDVQIRRLIQAAVAEWERS